MTTTTFWERLTQFLSDDDGLSKEQIRAELEEEGVDVDSFLKRIQGTIRKAEQDHQRTTANAERQQVEAAASDLSRKISAFSIEQIRKIVSQAENGKFGPTGQEFAIACRNKQDGESTEEELRALAEDVLLNIDDGNGIDDWDPAG